MLRPEVKSSYLKIILVKNISSYVLYLYLFSKMIKHSDIQPTDKKT